MSTPIALFIFNRPQHLARTLVDLSKNKGFAPKRVIVFADGPRHEKEAEAVEKARRIAREMLGPSATFRMQDRNKGLARSIIDGVSELSTDNGRVIVVEDDLAPEPEFLEFLERALDHYADTSEVMQISGHMFEVPEFKARRQPIILPLTTTWGWATWQRAWDQFDESAVGARRMLDSPSQRKSFNLGGAYDYANMLEEQLAGRRDSWGIRFYFSTFQRGGVAVFPPRTLVRNNGFDGSGSHGRGWLRKFNAESGESWLWPSPETWAFPPPKYIAGDLVSVRRAIWRQNGGVVGRISDRVRRAVRWGG